MNLLIEKDMVRVSQSQNETVELERVFARDMVSALICACFDRDDKVKQSAHASLNDYGQKAPNLVLNSLYSHLMPLIVTNHHKVDQERKVKLLESVLNIVETNIHELSASCRSQVILLASEELIKSQKKSLVTPSQGVSSKLLVSLAQHTVDDIMQEMIKNLRPGDLPSEGVVETIAALFTKNVLGMAAYIGQIFKIIVPLCGLVKANTTRVAFAKLFGNCCEAILEYTAVSNEESTITRETFSVELSEIYQSINKSTWITSRDLEVSKLTARTLGKICRLFDKQNLEEVAGRLISLLLSLFKRHNLDLILITKSLGDVLISLSAYKSDVLTDSKEAVAAILHNEICNSGGELTAETAKSFNELLRCFGILSERNATFLVHFILNKATFRDERIRSGNLIALRHLINASDEFLTSTDKELILKGFHKHLGEVSIKVRHDMTKFITAMATHDYLQSDGGREYVKFVVCECSTKIPSIEDSVHNNATVAVQLEEWEKQRKKQREMCSELLHLMATTIEKTDELFWPYLFEFLLKPNFENAFGPVVRVLHHISNVKLEKGEIEDSEEAAPKLENVSATDLIARFIVVLSDLKRFPDCACDTFLKLLRNLAICFDRNLVGLWHERITEMLEFCRNSNGQDKRMMRVSWEEKLLAFLSETLERMENQEWFCKMSTSISSQFSLYPTNSQSKNFSLRCYGVILSQIQDKDRIQHDLNLAVDQFIHSSARERQGLAMLMGYVASKHLDQVLSELQNTVAVYVTTKESSFSNFFSVFKSEKTLNELENAKSTVALSLGHLTYHMPREMLGIKLESEIIRMLLPLLRGLRSANSKSHAAEAIDLIGQALNNDHVSLCTGGKMLVGPVDSAIMNRSAGDGCVEISPSLTARDELLARLVKYFKNDATGDDTPITKVPAFLTKNIKILRACTTLSELEPTLNDGDMRKMLKPCLNYVMTCDAARKGEISYESEDEEDRLLGEKEILVTNARELNHLLVAILKKKNTLQNLEFIFQQFEDYLKSEHSYQRLRAIQCCENIFSHFLNHPFKTDSKTAIVSLLLAKIIPACGDNVDDIRLKSLMCVQRLLEIQIKCSGVSKESTLEGFGILTEVADKLTSHESDVVYDGIRNLSKLVCVRLPLDVLQYNPGSFTCALMDALLWKQQTSANTACLVLIHIFETRSALFERKVEQIVSCIFSKMDLLPYEKLSSNFTRNGILKLFVILFRHYTHQVLDAILVKSLPFSNAASECLLHAGADDNLMLESVDYLVDSLDSISPYEEASISTKLFKSSAVKRVASKRALTICTALDSLLVAYASKIENEQKGRRSDEQSKMMNIPLAYKVISSLIVRLGSMCEAKSPHNLNKVNPYRQALDLLRASFLVFFDTQVNKNLDNLQTWSCLDVEATSSGYDFNYFCETLHLILMTLCKNEPDKSEKMVSCVNKYVSSKFELQRATVVAFFAMVVQETLEGQLDLLLEIIINSLLSRLADNSPIVRKLCLQGLANIVYAPSHQIDRYGAVVIDALVSGMEDADDPQMAIALQAMNGLCDFLNKAPNTNIDAQLVNICLRVRPCFEKENVAIRSMAFRLFGMLANFTTSNTNSKFKDQIDTSFIQIVLHLFDSNQQVVKACKSALCRLGASMDNQALSEYLYDKLNSDSEVVDCNKFMNELSTIVIGGYPGKADIFIQRCIGFFTAQWPELRSAAALFSGHMLHNLDEDMRETINKDQIGDAFTQLMKDSDSSVRADAARSICLLYCY